MINKMKSVIRLSDGLGNQLFQYAFAYSYARKTGREVLLDPFFFGTFRSYQLERFAIDINRRFIDLVWDYLLGFGPRKARRYKERYRNGKIKKGYQIVQEKQIMSYDASVYQCREASYFIGFWQTPLYFEEYYEDIKRQFILKRSLGSRASNYAKQMKDKNSVSLHIRRTDYDRDINNACLDFFFYKEALKKMEEAVGDFTLFVFSDDKEFVKQKFNLHDYILVEEVTDIEEFDLMHRCKHHIVANSTFSWWGAYLGENKGGVVFAPVVDIWNEDFYPKEWNLIPANIPSNPESSVRK